MMHRLSLPDEDLTADELAMKEMMITDELDFRRMAVRERWTTPPEPSKKN
jgi:hypothetical protein